MSRAGGGQVRYSGLRSVAPLDESMRALLRESMTVPVAKEGGAAERARLVRALDRGDRPVPTPTPVAARPFTSELRDLLSRTRAEAEAHPLADLYGPRLDEIELDLMIRDARADVKRLRPLLARRYGTGRERVDSRTGAQTLAELAKRLLENVPASSEQPVLPPDAVDRPSFAGLIRSVALYAGLELDGVDVQDDLVANAVTTGATIRIANRFVGPREALRCAVHEVLGHAVSTFNANAQRDEIFAFGTAEAFMDQEGLALTLEEHAGVLDAARLRTLCARAIATTRFHDAARFEDVAVELHREHAMSSEEAIAITQRTYRGGGSAREAGYLRGWLRVRDAVASGRASVDELRNGKLSLAALAPARKHIAAGRARPAVFKPTLERALSFVDRAALEPGFEVGAELERALRPE